MDVEKSCICVFKGPKQFLTQVVSTRSYHLSTLDVNQCQDSPQVLLRHLSNHLPLNPLHSSWLVDLYNHLSSDIGRRHIAKGWEKAGIAQLLDESFSLPPEDPFEEIEGSIEIS